LRSVRAAYETYRELGGDHFTNRDPERQAKRLERVGHHVTLTEPRVAITARTQGTPLGTMKRSDNPGVASDAETLALVR
jgi:hypothetical protein